MHGRHGDKAFSLPVSITEDMGSELRIIGYERMASKLLGYCALAVASIGAVWLTAFMLS